MLEITKLIENGDQVSIELATDWSEVYYSSYVFLLKNKIFEIEDDYERSLKVISSVSSNPELCEKWLREMSVEQFAEEIIPEMKFEHFKDIKPRDIEFIFLNERKFRIQKDLDETRWGNATTFERLKDQFKDTEDYVLALGALLVEVDKDGKDLPFSLKTFDFVVNNVPDKVLMVELFHHVNFFLRGVKKQYSKTSQNFLIVKKR